MKNFGTLGARCAVIPLIAAVGLAAMSGTAVAQALDVVEVTGGSIKGVVSDIEGVTQFLGVPYAGNVGGENRWKVAPPVEPWEGVRVADTWGDQILQDPNNLTDAPISDNGLNVAVWTPAKSADEKLPVYMLIHGGANRLGANSWRDLYPAELASKGVIVVSVQYRLGAPAWLSLPEMAEENPEGPKGNFGVLDLVAALKWIEENIDAFGGDPDQVTIGGQSAGAENTVALLRTPLAKGLFERAVVQSSFTGFLPGKVVPFETKSANNQKALNELFGKEVTLADLRAIDAETWLAPWDGGNPTLFNKAAGAVATNQFYTIDDYAFTDDSVNLLQDGDFDGIDIMIGQTADEYTGLRPNDVDMTEEEQHKAMLEAIRPHQAGNVDESVFPLYTTNDPREAYRLSLRMLNDYMFQYVKVGAEHATEHSSGNVYLYYWDHWAPGKDQGFRRAWHGSDPWYWNGAVRETGPSQLPWDETDFRMRDLATTYLSNFIKSGNPNGDGVPSWPELGESGEFARFHEGEVQLRTETLYPERDAYLRAQVLKGIELTESDLGK